MGNRQRVRRAFFAAHPLCCFCGGGVAAAEEDHIPARGLFRERAWPEGYVFPACVECNRGSADDELAMAWLVRIQISSPDQAEERELERALRNLHDRHPDWIDGIEILSRTETRQELRRKRMRLADFGTTEIGVVKVPEILSSVPRRYAMKLAKALHYRHTGRIVPTDGRVDALVYPNSACLSGELPLDEFALLRGEPVISRAGKQLSDQFSYRYGAAPEGDCSAYIIQFGESMAIAAFVFEDVLVYEQRRLHLGFSDAADS